MVAEALRAAQQDGIVFIDEIDKIVETTRGISGATSKCMWSTPTAGWQLVLLLKAYDITSWCVVDAVSSARMVRLWFGGCYEHCVHGALVGALA